MLRRPNFFSCSVHLLAAAAAETPPRRPKSFRLVLALHSVSSFVAENLLFPRLACCPPPFIPAGAHTPSVFPFSLHLPLNTAASLSRSTTSLYVSLSLSPIQPLLSPRPAPFLSLPSLFTPSLLLLLSLHSVYASELSRRRDTE